MGRDRDGQDLYGAEFGELDGGSVQLAESMVWYCMYNGQPGPCTLKAELAPSCEFEMRCVSGSQAQSRKINTLHIGSGLNVEMIYMGIGSSGI
jgi:hypothetical protein